MEEMPIVCTPEEIPVDRRAEHGKRLAEVVMAKALEMQASSTGFEMRYAPSEWIELAKWIDLERLCCPFAAFELRVDRAGITLRLSGPEGTGDYLMSLVSSAR